MQSVEAKLEKLERRILRSKAWIMMVADIDIGVPHPKNPKVRPIRILQLYPDKRGMYPIALATDGEILFHEESFCMLSDRLLLKIMTHEMIHLYLADNGKDPRHYQDGGKLFEKCAKYLKANMHVKTEMKWRLPGQKRWRH